MKRENLVWCGLNLVLSGALISTNATAQPAAPKKSAMPPLSLAELEKLIGGRTLLKLDLKDATLEEAAAAIGEATGLKARVQSEPVFRSLNGATPPQAPRLAPPEQHYNFTATGQPFWEEFFGWQKATEAAQPIEPDMVLADGRTVPRPKKFDLGIFGVRQYGDLMLQPGRPFPKGRTVKQWPYLMIGTRLMRSQEGNLDATDLLPPEETRFEPVDPKKAPKQESYWQDRLIFNTRAYLDPKIKSTGLTCEIEEAIDDKGNDLRPTVLERLSSSRGSSPSYSDVGAGTNLQIAIHSQPNMGEKLVRLRGNLRFSVLTRSQKMELSDFAGARNLFTDGDFSVEFGGLTNINGDWCATFKRAGEGRLVSLFDSPEFRFSLVDETGQVFPAFPQFGNGDVSTETTIIFTRPTVQAGESPIPVGPNQNRFSEQRTFTFKQNQMGGDPVKIGKPVKLIVDLPIERREVVVPFEFTDLPLPPS